MKNVPFKRFLVNRNGGMWGSEPGSDEFDVLCIRVADFDYENLKTKASASTVRSITEKQLQKNQLHDGDILLEKSGGGEKTPVGRAVYYSGNDDAICSNFIERLTVNQQTLNPKFACYILSAAYSQRKNLDCIKQTTGIQNLSVDDYLSSVTIPLFDIETQKRITKWLDKQLSKVAQVITAKQAQLQKLSTYRQSLITRAVTKGLDPNVEMKDSGYDIANNIPIHWVTIKLQYLCKLATGNQDTQDAVPDGQYPFYVRSPTIERTNLVTYSGTGILIAGDGVGAGKVFHYAEGQYGIHQRVYLLSEISDLIDPKYLFFYIKTIFSCEVERGTAKSTVPSIRMPMLTRFLVCVPPKREQIEIRDYCQKVEEKTEAISEDIKNNIRLLKEYRSSLISAAVTGQLAIDEAEE
ncbi:MAG TPA: hypothetical protein DCL09_04910 [Sutterella sp.]|nr:hypothetical protein [Sutterella sp.]